jgi:hypothetical protein
LRKGNRKRQRRRRNRSSLLDQFAHAVHRTAWLAQTANIATLQEEIGRARPIRLRRVANSLVRLINLCSVIQRRLD